MKKGTFSADDVTRAWQRAQKAFRAMTPEEKKQTLVDSGILTRSGRVAKPYREVIKDKE